MVQWLLPSSYRSFSFGKTVFPSVRVCMYVTSLSPMVQWLLPSSYRSFCSGRHFQYVIMYLISALFKLRNGKFLAPTLFPVPVMGNQTIRHKGVHRWHIVPNKLHESLPSTFIFQMEAQKETATWIHKPTILGVLWKEAGYKSDVLHHKDVW
jgi:hypothetical protein